MLMCFLHACAGGYRVDVNLFGKKHRSGTHQYERVHCLGVINTSMAARPWVACGDSCYCLQVMECLRERTAPQDMLCIKTIDGTPAAIDWPAVPGVSFSQLQAPSCAVTTQSNTHAPDVATLVRGPALQADSMLEAQGVMLLQVCIRGLHSSHPCALLMMLLHAPPEQEAGSTDEAASDQLQAVHEWLGALACGMTGAYLCLAAVRVTRGFPMLCALTAGRCADVQVRLRSGMRMGDHPGTACK